MLSRLFFFLLSLLSFSTYAQDFSIDKTGGFQIEKVKDKEYILSFKATINNTSSKGFGVTIKNGKLYKNEEYLGTVQVLKKLKIKKSSKDNLDIKIKVCLEKELDIANEGIQVLLGKAIDLKVSGQYKVSWFIFGKKYPFEYKEKISMKTFINN